MLTTDLSDFDHFSRTNARRAGLDSLGRTSHEGMNLSQVGIPAALRDVVRVTDVISVFRTFSTKVADSSHCHTSFESKVNYRNR